MPGFWEDRERPSPFTSRTSAPSHEHQLAAHGWTFSAASSSLPPHKSCSKMGPTFQLVGPSRHWRAAQLWPGAGHHLRDPAGSRGAITVPCSIKPKGDRAPFLLAETWERTEKTDGILGKGCTTAQGEGHEVEEGLSWPSTSFYPHHICSWPCPTANRFKEPGKTHKLLPIASLTSHHWSTSEESSCSAPISRGPMAALQLNYAELLVGPGQQAGRRGVEEGGNPKDRTGAIMRVQKHCHRTSSRHVASTTFVYLWNSIPCATCSDTTQRIVVATLQDSFSPTLSAQLPGTPLRCSPTVRELKQPNIYILF